LIAVDHGDGRGPRRDVSVVLKLRMKFTDKEKPCGEIATVKVW